MLARDSVRGRMDNEAGISFTEFSYQLMQGYDFTHLARTHGCRVQLGGSDQWGNIASGCELGRRTLGQARARRAPPPSPSPLTPALPRRSYTASPHRC